MQLTGNMTQNCTVGKVRLLKKKESECSKKLKMSLCVSCTQIQCLKQRREKKKKTEKYPELLLSVATLTQICVDICSSLAIWRACFLVSRMLTSSHNGLSDTFFAKWFVGRAARNDVGRERFCFYYVLVFPSNLAVINDIVALFALLLAAVWPRVANCPFKYTTVPCLTVK